MAAQLAAGHDTSLAAIPGWDLQSLPPAGSLRSSANRPLTFLAANLGCVESQPSSAMSAMLAKRLPTGAPGLQVALGGDGTEIAWHGGTSEGYQSWIGYFNLRTRVGVEVDFVVSFVHLECAPIDCGGYMQSPITINNDARSRLFHPFSLKNHAALRPSGGLSI